MKIYNKCSKCKSPALYIQRNEFKQGPFLYECLGICAEKDPINCTHLVELEDIESLEEVSAAAIRKLEHRDPVNARPRIVTFYRCPGCGEEAIITGGGPGLDDIWILDCHAHCEKTDVGHATHTVKGHRLIPLKREKKTATDEAAEEWKQQAEGNNA